jgi:hypothetical protein
MSAFIVSAETMHRVVQAVGDTEAPTALGRALFDMNRRAVLARYPGDEDYAAVPPYQWVPRKMSAIEAFKAIECLLYQCSEGNVPDEPLFATLVAARDRLGVSWNTRGVQSAPWDF